MQSQLPHFHSDDVHCGDVKRADMSPISEYSPDAQQYRLVHNRLTAIATVTYYGMVYKGTSRILRFITRRFSPDVPVIEYSFVAFDQKTYKGTTGFRIHGLYPGAKIAVLYKAGKPSLNHPATSFIFYQFG